MRDRLLYTLAAAGVPVDRCPAVVGPGLVRGDLTFVGTPSPAQLSACDSVLASFDWSAAAHAAWETVRSRGEAKTSLDLADAQVKVLRAIVKVLLDEVNTLRGQVVGTATAVWDPASMANGTGVTSPNVTVPGAVFGDVVDVAAPYSLAGVVAAGYVSAANTVSVRLHNSTGGAVNLASGTWAVVVRRPAALAARTLQQARAAVAAALDAGEAD